MDLTNNNNNNNSNNTTSTIAATGNSLSSEFQCVLMAGGSSERLFPMTIDKPPSLLPVANIPMIHFQLKMLEKAGFTSVIIATAEDQVEQISHYIHMQYVGSIKTFDFHVLD